MEHAVKMVNIPYDKYNRLINAEQQIIPPVVNQLSDLDLELQAVLANPNIPSELKYHQYQSLFNRYQNLRNQQFRPPTAAPTAAKTSVETTTVDIPNDKLPIEDKALLDSLPKSSRGKARILLNHLKGHLDSIQWLNNGELVVDGKTIPGSNITDLVHYVTRYRPTMAAPIGAEEFSDKLSETNTPKQATVSREEFQTPTVLGTSFSPTPSKKRSTTSRTKWDPLPTKRDRKPVKKFGNWIQY